MGCWLCRGDGSTGEGGQRVAAVHSARRLRWPEFALGVKPGAGINKRGSNNASKARVVAPKGAGGIAHVLP